MKANDNAVGQFYVEVKTADEYFKVDCEITPLADWPRPSETMSEFGPGTYLVGRDIAAGTYRGQGRDRRDGIVLLGAAERRVRRLGRTSG